MNDSTSLSVRAKPELWFRPSLRVALSHLLRGVDEGTLTATIRLGIRDETHEKGYCDGDAVSIKVIQNSLVLKERPALVVKLRIGRLASLTTEDLKETKFYKSWTEAAQDLGFFEQRLVGATEMATIVYFAY